MLLKAVGLHQFLLIMVLAGSAYARTITCTIVERSNSHYIAPDITLTILDYGEVTIMDPIIASAGKKMVVGSVASETSQKIAVSWIVRNVAADPLEFRTSKPKLRVRLNIQKPGGAATISVNDLVHSHLNYRGSGTCLPAG
jgi:hypothetical protein